MKLTHDERRKFLRQSIAAALTVAYPFASSAADEIELIVVDSEGEYATGATFLFTADHWFRFQVRVFAYSLVILGNKIRATVGGRYPTYDIHIAIRQTAGALGFFSIPNFLNSQKKISLTHLMAVFATNIVPAVMAGFGQELLQLELRNRGAPTQVAKYAAGGLIGACVGFWTFFAVPSVVSAIERALHWETKVNRRRRLHEYAETNYASLITMLNQMIYVPLEDYPSQFTIYGEAPLENQNPPVTDALYQYLTVKRYAETRTVFIPTNTTVTSVDANISDLAFENGRYVTATYLETIELNPNQFDVPLKKS